MKNITLIELLHNGKIVRGVMWSRPTIKEEYAKFNEDFTERTVGHVEPIETDWRVDYMKHKESES